MHAIYITKLLISTR